MEVVLEKPSLKSEKKIDECDIDEKTTPAIAKLGSCDKEFQEHQCQRSTSSIKNSGPNKQDDKLESAKAEIGEVREENERLKMVLAQIVKDYRSLETQYLDISKQEKSKMSVEKVASPTPNSNDAEHELVSLSLGTGFGAHKKEDKASVNKDKNDGKFEGLTLGLDFKPEESKNGLNEPTPNISPDNSSDETKDEEPGDSWPPSKVLKNVKTGDDEASQQPQVKKARVSVRARCDTPTMNDGCQWRKYGQKIAKGNPCPRAYYRCTMAPSCPVRKQVQRCAEDMTILITTYEGTHNHPLPAPATAMASTTSAAANMLISGSSTSNQPAAMGLHSSLSPATNLTTMNASLHGLNFSISDPSRTRPQYYLPSTTNTSFSSIPSYPTITLDLTSHSQSTTTSTSQLNYQQANRFPSTFMTNNNTSRLYPSTNFSFSSSDSMPLPTPWSNSASSGYNLYNRNTIGSLNLSSTQPQDSFLQSYVNKTSSLSAPTTAHASQPALTDTIARALSSDPSFQSALAAALTTYVGEHIARNGSADGLRLGGDNQQHLSSLIPSITAAALTGSSHATSYLSRTNSSINSNNNQLMFMQTSLGLASSKSASAAPVDQKTRDNVTT